MVRTGLFPANVVRAVQTGDDDQGDEDKEDREHGDAEWEGVVRWPVDRRDEERIMPARRFRNDFVPHTALGFP